MQINRQVGPCFFGQKTVESSKEKLPQPIDRMLAKTWNNQWKSLQSKAKKQGFKPTFPFSSPKILVEDYKWQLGEGKLNG